MTAVAVYNLEPILDDRRFRGFHHGGTGHPSVLGRDCLLDDFICDPASSTQAPARLSPIWKPITVQGKPTLKNDFPCISMVIPAFSSRAVAVLGEMLTANGELLPVDSELGTYYAYNITTFADALDEDRSNITRFSESGRIMLVDRYEFDPAAVSDLTIFRLPQDWPNALVTDLFVKAAREGGLCGFDFKRLWHVPGTSVSRSIKLCGGSKTPAKRAAKRKSNKSTSNGNARSS